MKEQDFILFIKQENEYMLWNNDYSIAGKKVKVYADFSEEENGVSWSVYIFSNEIQGHPDNIIASDSGTEKLKEDALSRILYILRSHGFEHLPLFIMFRDERITTWEVPTLILKSYYYRFYNEVDQFEYTLDGKFFIDIVDLNKCVVYSPKKQIFYEYKTLYAKEAALLFIQNDYEKYIYKY
ncbi:hypothetical protein GRQ40_08760 [Anoxybacillus sp. PDR2]|uniref:hypothetical protein n=1 Tax=Anoxybacillus sp. PDR2 TaxID=1636720 RepID=UPI0013167C1A|nr:hypothetical protein [Anoxybacillus sp. PDR2]QHC04049.1 hypothetical protein GRQ40_08760 [Anoxybacillus sp. PDR2]